MKVQPFTLHLFIAFTSLLLIQCQNRKSQAPKAEGFDPPIPQTISYVAGSVTFGLAELQKKINRELDPVLVGSETKDGKVKGVISFRIKRLGAVRVQYVDQQIRLSAPLQMWLTKPFSKDTTPPKKPFAALYVNFRTPISVSPTWRFESRTSFTDYQWLVKPEVHLLGKELSLANLAQNILEKHKSDIEAAIDSAIHDDLRIDEMVKPIWHDMQKPLLINRAYGLWLVPKPISVASGPITGNEHQISTHLRIAFETKTALKPSPPIEPKTPLPILQKREQISQTSDLHVMSFIPYTDINRMLALTINNKNKKVALGTITIKQAYVYGSNHGLVVKADLSGLINKTVYLRGKPIFDTTSSTLRISHLDFADDTKEGLSNKSTWHNNLRSLLENLLTIPLGDDIAKIPQAIDKAYEQGEVGKKTDLGIKTFRFVPQKIAIRPDGIQALIKAETKIEVKVNQL